MSKTRIFPPRIWAGFGIAVVGAGMATAVAAADFTDMAPVVSVQPVVERVSAPRQECWTEEVQTGGEVREYRGERSYGGAVVGSIAGGVIGHQIGRGNGNTAATAAGAVIGALVGDNIENRDRERVVYTPPSSRPVQRCRTVEGYREEIRGYNVTYRYNGRDATTRMSHDPGRHVRVAIGVVDEQRPSSNTAYYR